MYYKLSCDLDWVDKGETVFGKNREFKVKESVILTPKATIYLPQTYYQSSGEAL